MWANLSKIHVFTCIVWLPDSCCTEVFCRTWREWLLYLLCLWNKPLIGRYALEDVVCEGNRRETSDQSDFHNSSHKKWLRPCLWKVRCLRKLSAVKLFGFFGEKKNSWLKTNRNLTLWPQTFSIWHKVLSKFEKTSLPADRNCQLIYRLSSEIFLKEVSKFLGFVSWKKGLILQSPHIPSVAEAAYPKFSFSAGWTLTCQTEY